MSGSSGGGGFGSAVDSREVSCADLVIHTQLNSPQASVVANMQVNEVLQVTTQQAGANAIPVVLRHGQVAGGIMVPNVGRLLSCIANGQAYKATVTSINGGQIKIIIEAV